MLGLKIVLFQGCRIWSSTWANNPFKMNIDTILVFRIGCVIVGVVVVIFVDVAAAVFVLLS